MFSSLLLSLMIVWCVLTEGACRFIRTFLALDPSMPKVDSADRTFLCQDFVLCLLASVPVSIWRVCAVPCLYNPEFSRLAVLHARSQHLCWLSSHVCCMAFVRHFHNHDVRPHFISLENPACTPTVSHVRANPSEAAQTPIRCPGTAITFNQTVKAQLAGR